VLPHIILKIKNALQSLCYVTECNICRHVYYYYYYYYLFTYLVQFSCHSVPAVLTLVQTKQIRINIRKWNNTQTRYIHVNTQNTVYIKYTLSCDTRCLLQTNFFILNRPLFCRCFTNKDITIPFLLLCRDGPPDSRDFFPLKAVARSMIHTECCRQKDLIISHSRRSGFSRMYCVSFYTD